MNWAAKDNFALDYDQDGCHDEGEDPDDDQDGVLDINDDCGPNEFSKKNWVSDRQTSDYDGDGCADITEDADDDDDEVPDFRDHCDPDSRDSNQEGWIPKPGEDENGDGCVDRLELTDADQRAVESEQKKDTYLMWVLGAVGILVFVALVIVGRKNEITNNQTNIFGDAF